MIRMGMAALLCRNCAGSALGRRQARELDGPWREGILPSLARRSARRPEVAKRRKAPIGAREGRMPSLRGPPNVREPVLVPCASATRRPGRGGNSKGPTLRSRSCGLSRLGANRASASEGRVGHVRARLLFAGWPKGGQDAFPPEAQPCGHDLAVPAVSERTGRAHRKGVLGASARLLFAGGPREGRMPCLQRPNLRS